ncbi:hypothetical protein DB31_3792 [Hyalangium minutum]|uniref:Uncharacterized protein n=1 Tax=Hyalangium minutum TaxID=394096 RepID=A0A085W4R5_9BACT|nr:hypothetical protein DB31_3792 [Hyalangium minutum]
MEAPSYQEQGAPGMRGSRPVQRTGYWTVQATVPLQLVAL